ncbi:MAG TPA: hypothetical protein PL085_11620 [Agriterribacter sp.]|uniref:hypothetical protein n=1 Tax=Agriterribacter sp. TaxID=2821509 RepID=UPI002D19EBC0|nr:hypothetical protein [Agriterribacter sp.]HRQ17718.1 hypothetical protein [Agriterribacter sp.]
MKTKKKIIKRAKDGRFTKGSTAAVKWTEKTVTEKLQAMWDTLATDDEGEKPANMVRANDIKTLAEVCLMHGISKQRISEWEKDFKDSAPISELLKNIKWVVETRLIYSGQFMDIFVLKNHYGYADKQEVDHTTKGKEMQQSLVFVDADSLSDAQIEKILNADNKNEGA